MLCMVFLLGMLVASGRIVSIPVFAAIIKMPRILKVTLMRVVVLRLSNVVLMVLSLVPI